MLVLYRYVLRQQNRVTPVSLFLWSFMLSHRKKSPAAYCDALVRPVLLMQKDIWGTWMPHLLQEAQQVGE